MKHLAAMPRLHALLRGAHQAIHIQALNLTLAEAECSAWNFLYVTAFQDMSVTGPERGKEVMPPPPSSKNSNKKMTTKRGRLYFMFSVPLSLKYMDINLHVVE